MHEWWLRDELRYAGAEHLDPAFVAGFDRKQGTDPAPAVATLVRYGLAADSVLVDLGAGTGTLTCAVAPRCGQVIAVDVSGPMLARLQDRAVAAGLGNVRCVRGGFLSYQHEGPPAGFVYTRNALHQLPDFWKALALERVAGMLRPGGVLLLADLIYDFQPQQAAEVFGRWLANAATDPAEGYTREDYAEHIRSEYSTFRWLLEPMLAAAGFTIAESSFRDGVYGQYVCRRR
jgi:SAM-dependent methyltransferase